MICPNCGVNDQQKIIETRRNIQDYIRRRRECVCGYRFTTIEINELNKTTLKVLEREMSKHCKPRSFEKIIYDTYRKIFDRCAYLKEKSDHSRRVAERAG